MRAAEVVALTVCDSDSKRMLIRVEQGKGGKDRHAMLSPRLLEVLRAWRAQAKYDRCYLGGRLNDYHRLPGGGDHVPVSEALRRDPIAAGYVEAGGAPADA